MNARPQFVCAVYRTLRRAARQDRGSQIVEFALSLPLLVVFVVGIFDFTGAYTLKQKLANAARESARAAASGPANDVGNSAGVPASVFDAQEVLVNYLDNARINDCGLRGTAPTSTDLTWTYTASGNGCPGSGVTLVINRGCVVASSGPVNVVGTCVSLQYGYQWRFNRVITLLVPGASYGAISTLNSTAMAMNEN